MCYIILNQFWYFCVRPNIRSPIQRKHSSKSQSIPTLEESTHPATAPLDTITTACHHHRWADRAHHACCDARQPDHALARACCIPAFLCTVGHACYAPVRCGHAWHMPAASAAMPLAGHCWLPITRSPLASPICQPCLSGQLLAIIFFLAVSLTVVALDAYFNCSY